MGCYRNRICLSSIFHNKIRYWWQLFDCWRTESLGNCHHIKIIEFTNEQKDQHFEPEVFISFTYLSRIDEWLSASWYDKWTFTLLTSSPCQTKNLCPHTSCSLPSTTFFHHRITHEDILGQRRWIPICEFKHQISNSFWQCISEFYFSTSYRYKYSIYIQSVSKLTNCM